MSPGSLSQRCSGVGSISVKRLRELGDSAACAHDVPPLARYEREMSLHVLRIRAGTCENQREPSERTLVDAAAVFPDVSQDELMAAPENYTIGTTMLLENERVRVWDITLGPGERMPFHCHRTTYFYRCESGGRWRLRTTEGEVLIGEDAPGEVTFHELAPGERLVHELTNIGDSLLRYTTVELLESS